MRISSEGARRGVTAAISGLATDLKAGVRVARQNPGMALLVMGTLGLGIAVNTTVFSWVDSVLLRPIPGAAEPGQIAVLEEVPSSGQTQACAYPDYRDYQKQADLFSGLAAWHLQPFTVGEGAGARRVYGQTVSANFFDVLGVKPIAGRVFTSNEDRDERAGYPFAVISHRLWRAQFAGDPKILGTAVRVNGHPLTIVGVAPPEFIGSVPGLTLDIWVHLSMIHEMGGVLTLLMPPGDLLIACANVANLLLARAVVQQREYAVRLAVGAGPLRVVRITVARGPCACGASVFGAGRWLQRSMPAARRF